MTSSAPETLMFYTSSEWHDAFGAVWCEQLLAFCGLFEPEFSGLLSSPYDTWDGVVADADESVSSDVYLPECSLGKAFQPVYSEICSHR